MREIIFRAKRLDNGEWVEGYLIYDEHDNLYRIVIKLEYSTGTHIDTMFAPRVSSKTIGQYTGLTDKNGTKIFEGDIVKLTETGKAYEVRFLYGQFYVGINAPVAYVRNEGCEVIGNIHDCPDLLKGGALE